MANLSNIYSYYVKMKTCVGSVLKWGNVPGASSGTNNRISNQHRVWPFGFLPAPGVAIRFYPEGNPRHLLVPSRETAPNFCSLLPSFLVCFHHRQKKATVIVRSTTRHLEGGAERERERDWTKMLEGCGRRLRAENRAKSALTCSPVGSNPAESPPCCSPTPRILSRLTEVP